MAENQKWSKEAEFLRSIFSGTTDAQRIATLEAKLAVAREALGEIEQFGNRNPGYGFSCAKIARQALQEIKQ